MAIVVYFDGGCEPKNPEGVATYGFLIYFDGKKIREGRGLAAKPWSKNASNNVAEYTGAIKALQWLIDNKFNDESTTVKGDSQLIIRQMKGEYRVQAPRLIPLFQLLKDLSMKFRSLSFTWIPREENEEADHLSKLAFEDYKNKQKQ